MRSEGGVEGAFLFRIVCLDGRTRSFVDGTPGRCYFENALRCWTVDLFW